MDKTSCRFDILNDGEDDLLLFLEPEGALMRLSPTQSVEVELLGARHPVVMKHWRQPDGETALSIWPLHGAYDVRLLDGDPTASRGPSHPEGAVSDADLSALDRLAAAAQAGPWTSRVEGRDHRSGSTFIMTGPGEARGPDIELSGATVADQDFIAAARSAIPALVAEVRRLQKIVAAVNR